MSASQTIDRLEHMGLINPRVDPSDSRACVLTRRGARSWRCLKPLLSAAQERIMAPLTGAGRQTCVQVARDGIGCRTPTGATLRFVTASGHRQEMSDRSLSRD